MLWLPGGLVGALASWLGFRWRLTTLEGCLIATSVAVWAIVLATLIESFVRSRADTYRDSFLGALEQQGALLSQADGRRQPED